MNSMDRFLVYLTFAHIATYWALHADGITVGGRVSAIMMAVLYVFCSIRNFIEWYKEVKENADKS